MRTFIVYTKPNCPFCVQAKALIERKKDQYRELVIGEHIQLNSFKSLFPDAKTVPQIVLTDNNGTYASERIGGFNELAEWYNNV